MEEEKDLSRDTTEKHVKKTFKDVNKKKKVYIIFIIIVVLFFIFISTIFAIINMNSDKIINGVFIQGIDVSKMTHQEAIDKMKSKQEMISKNDIILKYKDYTTSINPEQIELKLNYENAVDKAVKIGKSRNILVDNFNILKTNILKTNIDIELNYNNDILKHMIKSIDSDLPGAVKEVSYEINKNKLIITNGKSGVYINSEELENRIIKDIRNSFVNKVNEIEIPVISKDADPIDIEKIYSEIYKEAKDAYIEEEPFKLHIEEDGLDFAVSMEKAKEIIGEYKETYKIPLKIKKAKIKTEDLGDKLFKENLSKYTTIYDAGNASRSNNIAIAAKTINGKIILPGETFSYNKVLGNTTKEKGYQLGGAYQNGKVIQAYGGGICQVATTLYNAVLYANLEIVERHNHSYSVSYVPASRDATVSYGGKDFKFKNSRKYPIKLVSSAKNGVISIVFKGIKEEKEYDIEITSTTLSTTPFKTTYQDNSDLAEGKEKVIQVGHNGMKSKAFKVVKYNGKIISKTLLSADTYQPMNKIIEKGTKKAEQKEKAKEKEKTKKEEIKEAEAEITENED